MVDIQQARLQRMSGHMEREKRRPGVEFTHGVCSMPTRLTRCREREGARARLWLSCAS